MVEPTGQPGVNPEKDVSVPINVVYNHHFESQLVGSRASLRKRAGDAADFAEASQIINQWSKKVVHCGPVGAGDATKSINNVLNSGEIPNLFPQDELDKICGDMIPVCDALGVPASRDNCIATFVSRVWDKLHIALSQLEIVSPIISKPH